RLATRLLAVAVGLWLVSGSTEVALAAAGEPVLPSPINMIVFAGLSTATICLLIIRSHRCTAERVSDVEERVSAVGAEAVRGRKAVEALTEALDDMRAWMTRPAIPRPIRARATVVAVRTAVDEPTQPMPEVVWGPEQEAEIRGFMTR